jgi:hypothetical protein
VYYYKGIKMIKWIGLSLITLAFVTIKCDSSEFPKINVGASGILTGYNDIGKSYKINVGYSFSKNYSAELNYYDFGEASPFDGAGGLFAEGYSLELLAIYPINSFSLYAKLGSLWWSEKGERTYWWEEGTPVEHFKSDGNEIIYGVGANYSITKNIYLKIEYQQSLINTETVNPISVGFDIQF